jgi:hypothetical protein
MSFISYCKHALSDSLNIDAAQNKSIRGKIVIDLEVAAIPNGIKLVKSNDTNDIIKGDLLDHVNVSTLTAHIVKYNIITGESEVYFSDNLELNNQSQVEVDLPIGHYSILLTAKFGNLTAVLFDFYEINNQLDSYVAAMQPTASNEAINLMETSYNSYSDGQQMPLTWYNLLPSDYCTNYLFGGKNYGDVPELVYNVTCLHDTQYTTVGITTKNEFTPSYSSDTINGLKTPLVVDVNGNKELSFSILLEKGNNKINTSFSNLPEENFDYSKFFLGSSGVTSNNIYDTTIYIVE